MHCVTYMLQYQQRPCLLDKPYRDRSPVKTSPAIGTRPLKGVKMVQFKAEEHLLAY